MLHNGTYSIAKQQAQLQNHIMKSKLEDLEDFVLSSRLALEVAGLTYSSNCCQMIIWAILITSMMYVCAFSRLVSNIPYNPDMKCKQKDCWQCK